MIPTFAPPACSGIPGTARRHSPARAVRATSIPRVSGRRLTRGSARWFLNAMRSTSPCWNTAEQASLPVLGICFGAQSLNVFRGGTLIQDIPSIVATPVFHDDHGEPEQPARHPVRMSNGSILARLAGTETMEVNSFHHQSVANPGENLRAVATAPDGVIEAIEDVNGKFVIGVQWHPERGFQEDAFAKALFTAFIEEAGKSKSNRHPV